MLRLYFFCRYDINTAQEPGSLFSCQAMVTLQFAHVRFYACGVQKQVEKLANGFFYCWSLWRNNNTAINPQKFTSSYGSRRFSVCDQGCHCGVFPFRSAFFSRPGCLGLIIKNRVKFVFCGDKFISNFTVFNSVKMTLYYIVFACAHQVRKHAYRMKQNVFNRFHILI